MPTNSFWPSSEGWRRYWPGGMITTIAVIQLLISFALVIIHCAIVGIGVTVFCIGAAPWFIIGFICWLIFFVCWISVFSVTCCNRSSVCCATYVMIVNILAFIFSAVLIDFDNKFINGQIGIFIDSYIGSCTPSSNNDTDYLTIMVSLAKGQLAGSVIILVTSLIFIGIYIYVYIRALHGDRVGFNNNLRVEGQVMQRPRSANEMPQQPSTYKENTTKLNPNAVLSHNISDRVVCQNCGVIVEITERF